VKTLLDQVNVEDRGCTEKVFRGLSARAARPGHLSHLERPNFDFAQYLAERTGGFERNFGSTSAA
jgi:choline monooxygenase